MIETICLFCKNKFWAKEKGRKFCNQQCSSNYRKRKAQICPICKKLFIPTKKGYKHCSRKCGSIAKALKSGKRLLVNCKTCGKEIYIWKSKLKYNKNHFCSMKCYAIFRKELVRGDKNPKWRGGVSMVKGTISGYNKSPIKGRRYEWKTRRILEEQGYYCIRSAGSRGIFDILAFNETEIKLIQVKAGKSPLSPLEREEIEKIVVPSNASKEIWLWRIPRKPPEIIVIKQREENLENY